MDKVDRFAPHESAPYDSSKGVNLFIVIGLILLALIVVFAPIANEINDMINEGAPERCFKQFCSAVQDNYKNRVINATTYEEFYGAYTAGDINAQNYTRYQYRYAVDRDFAAEVATAYFDTKEAIGNITTVFELAYVLVVLIATWTALRTKKLKDGEVEELPAEAPEIVS